MKPKDIRIKYTCTGIDIKLHGTFFLKDEICPGCKLTINKCKSYKKKYKEE
jgi:hypothetical protein